MTKARHNRTLVLTGTGKGKTTAALGMALRAAGHGLRTLVIQFVKADQTTGEIRAVARLPEIEIVQTGLGFPPDRSHPDFARHQDAARRGLEKATEALRSGRWNLVVLDEVANAIARGLVDENEVVQAVSQAARDVVVVLTGRHAGAALIALADTVTEMQPLKHGLDAGWFAQEGVEY
jgi:cob(I)alamin adenosyltransferase